MYKNTISGVYMNLQVVLMSAAKMFFAVNVRKHT